MKKEELQNSGVYLLTPEQIAVLMKSITTHINELKQYDHPVALDEIKIATKIYRKFSYVEIKYSLQYEIKEILRKHFKKIKKKSF